MRRSLAIAVAAGVALPAPAQARPDAPNRHEAEGKIKQDPCNQRHVLPCIRQAARRHGVSYQLLARRAWCESTLNPYATNGPHAGLFQFNWGTWAGLPTRYSHHSPFSARWSSLAAAYMERVGRGNEWSCQ